MGQPHLAESAQLAAVLARIRRALRRRTRATFSLSPLPQAQLEVLGALVEQPEIRISEIAERLQLAPNTVSGLITTMVLGGLLNRRVDEADRRMAHVSLTASARRRIRSWRDHRQLALDDALCGLDKAELAAIIAALPALEQLAERLERPIVLPRGR